MRAEPCRSGPPIPSPNILPGHSGPCGRMLTQPSEGSDLDAKSALRGSVLRANSHTLLVWLPPGPRNSSGAPHFAERSVVEATLLGAPYRHTQVFRFDPTLGPSNVPRPKGPGGGNPRGARQML